MKTKLAKETFEIKISTQRKDKQKKKLQTDT